MAPLKQSESPALGASVPVERRRSPRFNFSATVEVIEIKSGAQINGRINEIGLGGCYADTLNPLPNGSEVTLRIRRENETFEANARVVYSTIGMGMGLAFTAAKPKQVQIFQRWLQEMNGENALEPETPSEPPHISVATQESKSSKNAVVGELITALMRKNILSEREGKEMLRKLSQLQD
jgi:hypothetical protein